MFYTDYAQIYKKFWLLNIFLTKKEDYNEAVADGTEWESRYYNLQDKWDATILKLDHENKILKSVLDEIREYIDGVITIWKTNPSAIATLDLEYLLQQIDKVKEWN